MKLEDQVVSLGLAKRLKELGVKQESYFHFSGCEEDGFMLTHLTPSVMKFSVCAAFTVAELGEMLPQMYQSWRGPIGWFCSNRNGEGIGPIVTGNIEADARAKCLVYLIENNLIPTPPRSE